MYQNKSKAHSYNYNQEEPFYSDNSEEKKDKLDVSQIQNHQSLDEIQYNRLSKIKQYLDSLYGTDVKAKVLWIRNAYSLSTSYHLPQDSDSSQDELLKSISANHSDLKKFIEHTQKEKKKSLGFIQNIFLNNLKHMQGLSQDLIQQIETDARAKYKHFRYDRKDLKQQIKQKYPEEYNFTKKLFKKRREEKKKNKALTNNHSAPENLEIIYKTQLKKTGRQQDHNSSNHQLYQQKPPTASSSSSNHKNLNQKRNFNQISLSQNSENRFIQSKPNQSSSHIELKYENDFIFPQNLNQKMALESQSQNANLNRHQSQGLNQNYPHCLKMINNEKSINSNQAHQDSNSSLLQKTGQIELDEKVGQIKMLEINLESMKGTRKYLEFHSNQMKEQTEKIINDCKSQSDKYFSDLNNTSIDFDKTIFEYLDRNLKRIKDMMSFQQPQQIQNSRNPLFQAQSFRQ